MDSLLDIGPILVRERRARGVTQRELALTLGVTQPQVARWEAGEYRTAGLSRVDAVARALGVSPTLMATALVPMVMEPVASYGAAPVTSPVKDLGECAARLREHASVLRDRFNMRRLGVFGSFADGTQAPSSDVDLLVETDDPGGLRFLEAADYVESILGRRVDLVRPDTLRDRLRPRVLREVIYVWKA
ncbi:MAG: helix-turn-helix domain-containing protein [Coriobacteriia bacterium]|nr:helix-turn-helix domain-containing protein [Coriobacteriia bacterium]